MYSDKVVELTRALDHGGSRRRIPINSRGLVGVGGKLPCKKDMKWKRREHQESRMMSFVDEVETKGALRFS
jgi:hypothetical protein